MKFATFFTGAATFVLATAPIALPTPAVAAANPRVAFCRALLAEEPLFANISLGECVSVTTIEDRLFDEGKGNPRAAAVLECNLLPQYAPDFYDTFASNKECIDYFLEYVL